jgi:iron complex transport system substrate-binding protein
MRIASLVPGATETVFALGLGDDLVGRSPECDHPAQASSVPVLGDRALDGSVTGGGERYHVDAERLRAAAPDLILTQSLCDACAATVESVRASAASVETAPHILSLDPHTLDEVFEAFLALGRAAGREPEAREMVGDLRKRMELLAQAVGTARKRRVVCLEALDPPFATGRWVPEMVDLAGGVDLLGSRGEAPREVSWEAVLDAAPEVLVLMPSGFDVARTEGEMDVLTSQEDWESLHAVRRGEVYLAHGPAYFQRPGPRLLDGIELLGRLFHPDRAHFPFGPEDYKRWEA